MNHAIISTDYTRLINIPVTVLDIEGISAEIDGVSLVSKQAEECTSSEDPLTIERFASTGYLKQ